MINFAQAQYLLLLLLVPFFFVIQAVVLKIRKKRIRKFGDEALVSRLMPSYSEGKTWIRLVLFSIGFIFFIIELISHATSEMMFCASGCLIFGAIIPLENNTINRISAVRAVGFNCFHTLFNGIIIVAA